MNGIEAKHGGGGNEGGGDDGGGVVGRAAAVLTPAGIVRRLTGARGAPQARRGDHDLNPGMRPDMAHSAPAHSAPVHSALVRPGAAPSAPALTTPALTTPALTAAAVLVPLVEREAGVTVLLTRRAETLADHAGEISFPGGRIEAADSSPEAAALRETEEELHLPREGVRVLGRLDLYDTRTGFRVCPVVGLLRPPLTLDPDPVEVAAVFEVPLAHVMDPANHRRHHALAGGRRRCFYAIPYGEHFIWGATAGMLINLYEVLRAP